MLYKEIKYIHFYSQKFVVAKIQKKMQKNNNDKYTRLPGRIKRIYNQEFKFKK